MAKTSDTQYFRPDIDVSVDFWCCETPFQSNWQKSKLIATHPTLPFLLSCDVDQVISIWNIATQQLVWNRSAALLIKECSGVSPISIFHHDKLGMQRFSARSSQRSHGLSRNLEYSVNKVDDVISDIKSKEMSFGEVKFVDFADTLTLTFNGSYHNSKDIYLENRILILFEQAIIIVNYSTHQYSLICSNDLMGKKPSSVEFLDEHNCAIGCNDGMVRIWNIKKSCLERAFSCTKYEITYLKVIPTETTAVSEAASEGKIRLLTVGSDGIGYIWMLNMSSNGELMNELIDTPICRLQENLGSKLSKNSILFCRDNQLLFTFGNEQRIYVWDIQEIAGVTKKRVNLKKKEASRRVSLLAGKLMPLTPVGNDSTEELHVLSCHGIMKLEKSMLSMFPKVSTLCSVKHPFFGSGIYALASKTGFIAIAQNKASIGACDESERSSTVAGAAVEKQRLELLQCISLEKHLLDYAKRTQQNLQFTDPLKIYCIQCRAVESNQLVLATSYGPIVLSFPFLPRNIYTSFHPKWHDMKVLCTDTHLRAVVPNPNQSKKTDFQEERDIEYEVLEEIQGIGLTNDAGNFLAPVERKTFLTSSTQIQKSSQIRAYRPQLFASPSGEYLTLFLPDNSLYIIYSVRPSKSFQDNSVPTNHGQQNNIFDEVGRGYCLEFAWVDMSNSFIIRTCKQVKILNQEKMNKRSSLSGLFSKAEKPKYLYKDSELILKQINRMENDGGAGSMVVNEMICGEICIDSHNKDETISLASVNILQLFSGPILGINYTFESSLEVPLPVGVIDDKQLEKPRYESIQSYQNWYSRFFSLRLPEVSSENESINCELLPISPVMLPIQSVCWDYNKRNHGCVMYRNGSMQIVTLFFDDKKCQRVLQTLQSIETNVYSSFHVSATCWWNGLLYIAKGKHLEVYSPTKLYVEDQSPSQQFQPLTHRCVNSFNQARIDMDWKSFHEFHLCDITGTYNGHLMLAIREGALKYGTITYLPMIMGICESQTINPTLKPCYIKESIVLRQLCDQSSALTEKQDAEKIFCLKGFT